MIISKYKKNDFGTLNSNSDSADNILVINQSILLTIMLDMTWYSRGGRIARHMHIDTEVLLILKNKIVYYIKRVQDNVDALEKGKNVYFCT